MIDQLSNLKMDKTVSNDSPPMKAMMEDQLDIIRVRHNSIKKKKEAIQQLKTQEPKDLKPKLPTGKTKVISRNSIIKDCPINQTEGKMQSKAKTLKQTKKGKTTELISSNIEIQS